MALIFRRNFDDELAREMGADISTCTCSHPSLEEIEARIDAAKLEAYQAGLEKGHSKALEEFHQDAEQNQNQTLTTPRILNFMVKKHI